MRNDVFGVSPEKYSMRDTCSMHTYMADRQTDMVLLLLLCGGENSVKVEHKGMAFLTTPTLYMLLHVYVKVAAL